MWECARYGDWIFAKKARRQRLEAEGEALRLHLFPVGGRNFAGREKLSVETWRRDIWRRIPMHGLIYLVGLIVVILAVLSFFGLR
jgi:hypothetical protein